MTQPFSHRQARSTSLITMLTILVVLETVAVHLLLWRYSVFLAVIVSLLSLSALIWLMADYRALGTLTTIVTDANIILRVGHRARATIPRNLIASAISPSWRDLPDVPNRSYLNATKPADPNILLKLKEPIMVHLPAGIRRPVIELAVFFDRPDDFLAAIKSGKGSTSGGAT